MGAGWTRRSADVLRYSSIWKEEKVAGCAARCWNDSRLRAILASRSRCSSSSCMLVGSVCSTAGSSSSSASPSASSSSPCHARRETRPCASRPPALPYAQQGPPHLLVVRTAICAVDVEHVHCLICAAVCARLGRALLGLLNPASNSLHARYCVTPYTPAHHNSRHEECRHQGTAARLWRPRARPRAAAALTGHAHERLSWDGGRLLRGARYSGSPCSTGGLGGGDLLQRVRLKLLGEYLLRQLAVLHGLLVAPPARGHAQWSTGAVHRSRGARGRTCAGRQSCTA